MKKLKEIVGSDHYKKLNASITDLLNTKSDHKVSLLIQPEDNEIETIRILQHDGYPTLEIELSEVQVGPETTGYISVGEYTWKPIKLFGSISTTEHFQKTLMVNNKNQVFELTDVIISKKDMELTFESAKLL